MGCQQNKLLDIKSIAPKPGRWDLSFHNPSPEQGGTYRNLALKVSSILLVGYVFWTTVFGLVLLNLGVVNTIIGVVLVDRSLRGNK